MSEDLTQKMPDRHSFEERVLSELAAIRSEQTAIRNDIAALDNRLTAVETRLVNVEDKVDARLRETRPIWENVQARLTTIEKTLEDISLQFNEILKDSMRCAVA